MDFVRQETVTVSLAYHSACDKGLLLHAGLGAQGTCHIVKIPHLIPLIGGKGNGIHDSVSSGGHTAIGSQCCSHTAGQITVVAIKANCIVCHILRFRSLIQPESRLQLQCLL